MSESSTPGQPTASPLMGTGGVRPRATVAAAIRGANRAAVETALGKADTWCRSVINGNQGVTIDDIDPMLDALGLKAVPKHKRCVDAEIFDSVMAIHEKLAPNIRRLVWDDSE